MPGRETSEDGAAARRPRARIITLSRRAGGSSQPSAASSGRALLGRVPLSGLRPGLALLRPRPRTQLSSVRLLRRPLATASATGVPRRLRARRKPPPAPEATLTAQPLHSSGVAGPLAASLPDWEEKLHDDLRRSFVSFRRGAFTVRTLRDWWSQLSTKIRWEQPRVGERKMPRSAAWFTSGGCKCRYNYGGTSWPAIPMEPWFQAITDCVCRSCGIQQQPNSCNANFYEDGRQSVGWHADDEPLFDASHRDALIVSLSLGATRLFDLHPNDDPGLITSIALEDGDLCTMEGLTQKHYRHRVPPQKSVKSARINLTWRWVVVHESTCPNWRPGQAPARPSVPHVVDLVGDEEPAVPSADVTPEEAEKRRKRALRFSGGRPDRPVSTDDQRGPQPDAPNAAAAAAEPADPPAAAAPAPASVPAAAAPAPAVASAPAAAAEPQAGEGGKAAEEEKRRQRAARFGEQAPSVAAAGAKATLAAAAVKALTAAGPRLVGERQMPLQNPTKVLRGPVGSAPAQPGGAAAPVTLDEAERRRKRKARFDEEGREPAGAGPSGGASPAEAITSDTPEHERRRLRAQRFREA